MCNRMMRSNLGSTLLIGASLALSVGMPTMALAQPGSSFQTRGEREWEGKTAVPSPYGRSFHSPEAYGERYGLTGRYGGYAYGGRPWVRYHRFGRYHHYRY